MPEIDRPFDGLDEVWIWSAPHPADPEPRHHEHLLATRIGVREGPDLVGRVQVVTRQSRTILGVVEELQGIGPWRKAKLGKVTLLRAGEQRYVRGGEVRSGKAAASWKPGGHFHVGDHVEVNQLATAGRPCTPTVRSLLRRLRDRDAGPGAEPAELTAFDRWLVATPADVAGERAWRVTIDRHAGAPDSVGLGLAVAAIGLLHRDA